MPRKTSTRCARGSSSDGYKYPRHLISSSLHRILHNSIYIWIELEPGLQQRSKYLLPPRSLESCSLTTFYCPIQVNIYILHYSIYAIYGMNPEFIKIPVQLIAVFAQSNIICNYLLSWNNTASWSRVGTSSRSVGVT